MDWKNSNVLITGASRGLGFALASALARQGAGLAIVSPHLERLHDATRSLRSEGARVHPLRADIGDKHAIHRIVGEAQALLGPIDVLIHNASTLGPEPLRGLLDTECEDFARALEVNVLGPFRLSKALAAGMVLRGRGLIVHVSSDAAVMSYPDWGAYGISKAALDHLSRQWATELAATAVRVLSIDPGEMDTAMHRAAMPDADTTTLRAPADVATRFLRIFQDPARYPSGTRLSASDVTTAAEASS